MQTIIALLFFIWAMLFTAARFLQYFRIVKEYTEKTTAKVVRVSRHEPNNKKEKEAVDVVMEYTIEGKEGQSEVTVPATMKQQYPLGKELPICYKVSENGTVHIASDTTATKKLMYAYAIAIVIEFLAFFIVWWMMIS